IDSQGGLYTTGAIVGMAGGLYFRSATGEWTFLNNLSNDTLASNLQRLPREDIGYGNITAMAFGPEGTLYMVGLNGTALARSATDGSITAIPFQPLYHDSLVVSAPDSIAGEANTSIPITAAVRGGAGDLTYN